jgi:fumarylpyruvate hydrolase
VFRVCVCVCVFRLLVGKKDPAPQRIMSTPPKLAKIAVRSTTWSVPHLPIVTRCSETASTATRGEGVATTIATTTTASSWKLVELFPVHRIYCVGRNYKEHAAEMKANVRDPPFFFLKPADTAISTYPIHPKSGSFGTTDATSMTTRTLIHYPGMTSNLHFEGELVIAVGKDQATATTSTTSSTTIDSTDDALSYVLGYAIACDLTRRDLQNDAKQNGRPWDTSKSFEQCCPMSAIVQWQQQQQPHHHHHHHHDFLQSARLTTTINETCRQDAALNDMTWSVPEIIMHLSRYYQLRCGDLILTGTPAGVGPLSVGDTVRIQVQQQGGTGGEGGGASALWEDVLPPCEFEVCE